MVLNDGNAQTIFIILINTECIFTKPNFDDFFQVLVKYQHLYTKDHLLPPPPPHPQDHSYGAKPVTLMTLGCKGVEVESGVGGGGVRWRLGLGWRKGEGRPQATYLPGSLDAGMSKQYVMYWPGQNKMVSEKSQNSRVMQVEQCRQVPKSPFKVVSFVLAGGHLIG